MPYIMPTTPSPHEEDEHHDLPPLKLRKHRRARSAALFSDERGLGAYTSLPNVPRRKPVAAGGRKTDFHFTVDDPDSDSSDDFPPPPPPQHQHQHQHHHHYRHTASAPSMNSLGLSVNTRNLGPPSPPPEQDRPTSNNNRQTSSVAFPSRPSPANSPHPDGPRSPPIISPPPRTPSTPIILSNGKPLKPSLKSSLSSPNIPTELRPHIRAQSAPSTPFHNPKNVHFAEKDALQSVKVYDKTSKPANLSRNCDETETETEGETSTGAGYPFPTVNSSLGSPLSSPTTCTFELDQMVTTSVPVANPPLYANVHLETLTFPRTRPLTLRGSILVRNLTYHKDVAVRFTLDNWQTTSEVACKYVASLPSLPPPFKTPHTAGDMAASSVNDNGWDRFSFMIMLDDFERKLAERTIFFVVRFTAPGIGEWWDNNQSQNYRAAFNKITAHSPPASPVNSHSQQRTFSAPPTLKGTPTTAEVVHAHAQAVPSSGSNGSSSSRSFPFSLSLPKFGSPPPSAERPPVQAPGLTRRSHSSPQPFGAAKYSVPSRPSLPTKLNLLNYAAPVMSSPSTSRPLTPPTQSRRPEFLTKESEEKVAKVETGVGATSEKRPPSPPTATTTTSASDPRRAMGAIIGGMPTTTISTSPEPVLPPFKPSSASSRTTDFSWPSPSSSSNSPSSSDTESPRLTRGAGGAYMLGDPRGNAHPSETSPYAAFVKQFCFAQGPVPSPSSSPPVAIVPSSKKIPETDWIGVGSPMSGGGIEINGITIGGPTNESLGGLYPSHHHHHRHHNHMHLRSDSPMLATL